MQTCFRPITLCLFAAIFAGAAYPVTSADILSKVAQRYKSLTSYQIEAEEQLNMMRGGRPFAGQHKISLAVGPNGMFRVEENNGRDLEIRVSDGKLTWKALPKQKIWSKQEIAEMPDDDPDGQDAEPSMAQDLFSEYQRLFVARYTGFARYPDAVLENKTEKIKFDGDKVDCYVIRIVTKGSTNRLFIARDSFFVLRHIESQILTNGAQAETVMDYKTISEGVPGPKLFEFQPGNGSREVADVSLPSERNIGLVGQLAADFTLNTLDGSPVRLSSLRGKIVLLDFWASWCMPCRHELPAIEAISRKYKDRNVVVFGVNDEDAGTAKHFLDKYHPDLATLHDGDKKVHKLYGCRAIPTVLVIDPQGRIAAHFVGSREETELIAALKGAGMN
ncbi:MAG: TlpA family protein disulfide reductase [Acidobacteriaceae bacterium]|nr:TlpA family protein disulfide reductase [Acidobacteriaceae bacterium]